MMQDKYINPFTDFGFKKLFGEEPHKELLISFLNTLLPEKHRIQDLQYTHNEHQGYTALDRKAIFDLNCISPTGERFIVELQKAKHNFFKDRSLYYATFPIQEQAQRGDWDYKLAVVYTIGILDFVFEEDRKIHATQDKWLYIFRHLHEMQEVPAVLHEAIFLKLFEAAQIACFNPAERQAYEDSLKYYRDLKNVTDTARDEGEQKKAVEIARNLLDVLDDETIAEKTGLSLDDVRELRQQN